MVFEVAIDFSSSCLAAKHSDMGAEVDGSDCRLHRPMAYGHQTRTQSLLTGVALSHRAMETRVA
jgi:hypothetical protein